MPRLGDMLDMLSAILRITSGLSPGLIAGLHLPFWLARVTDTRNILNGHQVPNDQAHRELASELSVLPVQRQAVWGRNSVTGYLDSCQPDGGSGS